jgi:hypothetical protein
VQYVGQSKQSNFELLKTENTPEWQRNITIEDIALQTFLSVETLKEIELLLNEKNRSSFMGHRELVRPM